MSDPTPIPSTPYSRANPYLAHVTSNDAISTEGSKKDTRHVVVNLKDSGIQFKPGDSLGVFARNLPRVVDELLPHLGLSAAEPVIQPNGETLTLREVLMTQFILNRATKKFVKALLEKLPEGEAKARLAAIVADDVEFDKYLFTRDYTDVLIDFPAKFTLTEFIPLVNKIAPRLYSIASSLKAHPGEVHLTVAIVNYETHGRIKYGLASGFLAHGQECNKDTIPIYIQPTKHFHMPAPEAAMIMVGPGTGIAPFRAFLQDRQAEGAKGRNWLFFGDQHEKGDFLYESEFKDMVASGHLTRFDTAFSRDQEEKIYVQDRMEQNGAEMWQWLKDGAYFYVCGDAKRMARDVHASLIKIAEVHGQMTPEAAKEYIEVTLAKTEKRYLKDVY